jgi:hypothetical protein
MKLLKHRARFIYVEKKPYQRIESQEFFTQNIHSILDFAINFHKFQRENLYMICCAVGDTTQMLQNLANRN